MYALFGIPLFFCYLSNNGNYMASLFQTFYLHLCYPAMQKIKHSIKIVFCKSKSKPPVETKLTHFNMDCSDSIRFDQSKSSEASLDDLNKTVPLSITILIMTGYILLGAIVFCLWESTDYLKWSYFCFITLSTIGFGDIVPG